MRSPKRMMNHDENSNSTPDGNPRSDHSIKTQGQIWEKGLYAIRGWKVNFYCVYWKTELEVWPIAANSSAKGMPTVG